MISDTGGRNKEEGEEEERKGKERGICNPHFSDLVYAPRGCNRLHFIVDSKSSESNQW
jgi:hypothetical protein